MIQGIADIVADHLQWKMPHLLITRIPRFWPIMLLNAISDKDLINWYIKLEFIEDRVIYTATGLDNNFILYCDNNFIDIIIRITNELCNKMHRIYRRGAY